MNLLNKKKQKLNKRFSIKLAYNKNVYSIHTEFMLNETRRWNSTFKNKN
jgi:hypothetical protein